MGKKKAQSAMKIYMAGPLFTAAERMFNAELARRLRRSGHEVWLPQEMVARSAADYFELALKGILWCDVVLACMDGPDPDSGTCGECGYAYLKRPIVAYRTDYREGGDAGADGPGYNLMLMGFATLQVRATLHASAPADEALNAVVKQLLDVLRSPRLREDVARLKKRSLRYKVVLSSLYGKMGVTKPEGRKGRG